MMDGSSHSFSVGSFSRKVRFKPFLLSNPVEPVVGLPPAQVPEKHPAFEMNLSPELPISSLIQSAGEVLQVVHPGG
jgi:hypothetical protein